MFRNTLKFKRIYTMVYGGALKQAVSFHRYLIFNLQFRVETKHGLMLNIFQTLSMQNFTLEFLAVHLWLSTQSVCTLQHWGIYERKKRTRTKHLKYLYPSYRGKFGQTMYSQAYFVYIFRMEYIIILSVKNFTPNVIKNTHSNLYAKMKLIHQYYRKRKKEIAEKIRTKHIYPKEKEYKLLLKIFYIRKNGSKSLLIGLYNSRRMALNWTCICSKAGFAVSCALFACELLNNVVIWYTMTPF